MLLQVDNKGFTLTMLDSILELKHDEQAVSKDDQYATTKCGCRCLSKTKCGWKLLVRWKDGSESWIPLKDTKESHPVESAEFAKDCGIATDPAFIWWVPHTLRKRDVIISSVKSRIRCTTYKYGIEIPTSIEHERKLDEANGNDLWRKATKKEMINVGIEFEVLEHSENVPVGWHEVTGHIIFDVKMDFTRKVRWVLDGHKKSEPKISTYSGVVSRESVRIALTYAALNVLDVTTADIRNAYLQAPSSQCEYIVCGPDSGLENAGKKCLIRRALYWDKNSGRDFWNYLRSCMHHIGFESCKAYTYVWMRAANKEDGR